MEETEKIMIQTSEPWGDKAFPIDCKALPEEVSKRLTDDGRAVDVLSCDSDGEITRSTVSYFRVVKRFRRGVSIVEGSNNVVFGI